MPKTTVEPMAAGFFSGVIGTEMVNGINANNVMPMAAMSSIRIYKTSSIVNALGKFKGFEYNFLMLFYLETLCIRTRFLWDDLSFPSRNQNFVIFVP